MELIQCITCGSSEFNNGKCAYCGNQYKLEDEQEPESMELWYDNGERGTIYGSVYPTDNVYLYEPREGEEESDKLPRGSVIPLLEEHEKLLLGIMLYILAGVIWFGLLVCFYPVVIPLTLIFIGFKTYKFLTNRKK